ncbi:MAG: hypothetical protein AMXMBFR7_38750 [Planctomycetota bacterium]
MAHPEFANPAEVFEALGLGAEFEPWKASWASSQATYPARREIPWLTEAWVAEACAALKMPADAAEAFQLGRAWLAQHPAARRLAWHGHDLLFHAPADTLQASGRWGVLPESLGDGARMFQGLVLLSGHRIVRQRHAARGIPETITLDTLSDLELWTREYKRQTGHWGCRQFGWLRHHFTCDLFKLGRLQFNFHPCRFHVHVLRHTPTGRVVALAEDGQRFRADGQYWNADRTEAEDFWTSRFECDGRFIRGNRIDPAGFAVREPVELPVDEYRKEFGWGDHALGIHIAASGPMDHAACGDSMRQACDFFPRHFPEYRVRGFCCSSWLLDAQFEAHLAPESNIVRFLREYYLLPLPGANDEQHFERVFDGPVTDPDRAPQNSSLQKAMIRHVKQGGRWRGMGCFYLPEDLNWGQQVYRRGAGTNK